MAEDDRGASPRPDPGRKASRPPGLASLAGSGLEFAIALLVGLFGGQWLDRRLGTGPWLLMLGVFAGAAAGFYNLYRAMTMGGPPSSSPGTGKSGGPDAP